MKLLTSPSSASAASPLIQGKVEDCTAPQLALHAWSKRREVTLYVPAAHEAHEDSPAPDWYVPPPHSEQTSAAVAATAVE